MTTNISQKTQKDKLFALHKEAFLEELLTAKPQDYQDRNWFYHFISIVLSYPLQLISILAGSYLLYDIAQFIWQLENGTIRASFIFVGCIVIFLGIETLRRWLIQTTGYHFIATFSVENQRLVKGEWLRIKIYWLLLISVLLITSGTIGTYLYIKHNSPKADVLSIEVAISPLEQKIKKENVTIAQIDKNIEHLFQTKRNELKDFKNYSVWEGKEYLLPEVKQRHLNYDRQVAEMQQQRKTHQALVLQYEQKLNRAESSMEKKNAEIIASNQLSIEVYAGVSAGLWLCFELLLVFMLSYTWIFRYGVKREKLLETIEIKNREKLNPVFNLREQAFFNSYYSPHLQYQELLTNQKSTLNELPHKKEKKQIGFDKWYEKPSLDPKNKSEVEKPEISIQKDTPKEIIIKEVPVLKEIIIEKEVPVEVIVHQNIENEGFMVKCAHCGKQETKKRPAKYCSSACRNKAWKLSNSAIS